MLITFNPEDSKDFNVEGGGGLPKLPVGVYDIDMAIVNIDAVQKDNAPLKLAVTYAVVNPKSTTLSAGQQFGDYINIQNPNPLTSKIARQTIAKLGFGVTGDKEIMAKGQLNFDASLYNRPFSAVVTATETAGGLDDKGNTITYKNVNIGKVAPITTNGNTQPTQQPTNNGYNTQPQQQTQPAAWGAPQ